MNLKIRNLTNKNLNKLTTDMLEERERKPKSNIENNVEFEKESQNLILKVVSGLFECQL